MSFLSEEKARLRREALAARKALSPRQRQEYSRQICARLLALPELQQARSIFSYRAKEEEADLSGLHESLWQAGKTLAFPRTEPRGRMEAVPAERDSRWQKGAFGLWEPAEGALLRPEELELVLLPCVAFDKKGTRLGWGGGYYDRYLPRCSGAKLILVAFEAQRLESLPREPQDVPADAAVSEKGIWRF